jgi:hypothetical protein
LTESGLNRTWKAKLLESLEQKDKLSTSIDDDDDDKHLLPLESFSLQTDTRPLGPILLLLLLLRLLLQRECCSSLRPI